MCFLCFEVKRNEHLITQNADCFITSVECFEDDVQLLTILYGEDMCLRFNHILRIARGLRSTYHCVVVVCHLLVVVCMLHVLYLLCVLFGSFCDFAG